MGYIHCCGALHKTRTYRLAPYKDFIICEVDVLNKCPVCGCKVIQLTRITENADISCVRRTNAKADAFFDKLKKYILYEMKPVNYKNCGKFYLNYNEFGVIKRCYSNLANLKLGRNHNSDNNIVSLEKFNLNKKIQ